ncbi:hypothetical protein XENTR_v10005643 [Xenopus tropicalis]|uniref:Epidermal growth factor receptor kinase substrate 8-like protein 3 isoform X1 n=1 Tax=Xenopus tropicalis TaxID=8364 RepID=A0A8J0SKW2_XENTR|nr:epidermal growth factor receptor kinase substrate 8-like protein 3 isoform X1 [Xenopus tropicalis]KAE8623526.1 hypothetical protein XENTR_v10005643 [Xenopus tropicalis]KAE8623527.1 hypothetical protein XENTR_v10005643 [Xenopus tropicalis]KAE8623528.1 hypothetical protein XENTR_v10005643 [Xenopus tropicalis]|eukprot:XP_012817032.1 PREDICTED: epidermal growth factor receptor kinase substrate 8-like protein 3 isoform X1 [Xenopus tropicalis]
MDNYMDGIDGVLAQREGLTRSRSISRPTAKNIYQQRKQYAQSLSTAVTNFQHRVEHLLTCDLDKELRNVEDCLKHLSFLEAQGRIWGQGLILQLENGEILLKDPETKDSLEQLPLQNVDNCSSVLGGSTYNSLLTIKVQTQQKTSIFFFQCDEQPADVLHANLEKALKQFRLNKESKDTYRYNLENSHPQNNFLERSQSPQSSGGWDSPRMERQPKYSPRESPIQQRRFELSEPVHPPPSTKPPPSFQAAPVNSKSETERDIEILNHLLGDIELFVGKLNIDKKKKKAKLPESEFVDCLQKAKYAFILMGNVHEQMKQPSAPDLIHLMMETLAKIVDRCPQKDLPQSVLSPLLTQKALMIMSSCVTDKERKFWESLGDAWMKTRAEWPNGKNIPQYVPTFSDGWIIPDIPFSDVSSQMSRSPETPLRNRQFHPLLMNVLHDFEARNNRELSVRKGDIVKVLDQSRQWWMVQNSQGQQGFIPSNILENTDDGQAPASSVVLNPSSRPEEVKAWLQQKGFSNITVRCLGVLQGDQLLELTREDLKTVCPEEGGRVYLQLSTVRGSLET